MKTSFALLTMLLPSVAAAAPYSLEQVLQKLEDKQKSLQVVKFDFAQDVEFAEMKSAVKGEAYFGQKGVWRVSKNKPDQQVTVSDGKKIWVYNPAFNQVWEGSAKTWLTSSAFPKGMIPLENYVQDLKNNFDLSLAEAPAAESGTVHLVAKYKNPQFAHTLELSISTDQWLPSKTVYVSDSAKVTTVISNVVANPTVPAGTFRFQIPKGAERISLN